MEILKRSSKSSWLNGVGFAKLHTSAESIVIRACLFCSRSMEIYQAVVVFVSQLYLMSELYNTLIKERKKWRPRNPNQPRTQVRIWIRPVCRVIPLLTYSEIGNVPRHSSNAYDAAGNLFTAVIYTSLTIVDIISWTFSENIWCVEHNFFHLMRRSGKRTRFVRWKAGSDIQSTSC